MGKKQQTSAGCWQTFPHTGREEDGKNLVEDYYKKSTNPQNTNMFPAPLRDNHHIPYQDMALKDNYNVTE